MNSIYMNLILYIVAISIAFMCVISIVASILSYRFSSRCRYLCCNRCLGYAPAVKINTPEVETTTKSTLISLLL